MINKIDLPNAEPERVIKELEDAIGFSRDEVVLASAKTGQGIEDILDAIVERVPAPKGDPEAPLQALIFDSHFDSYQGAVAYVRIVQGTLKVGDHIQMMSSGKIS